MTSFRASSASDSAQEGIDLSHLRQSPNACPIHSVILVERDAAHADDHL